MDIGRQVDAAVSLREIALEYRYSLFATQTVLEELFHISQREPNQDGLIAERVLTGLPKLGVVPYQLSSQEEAISLEFSKFLREHRALPEEEVNDGIILAEASLANAALLASSDSHLLSIDPDELRVYFEVRDLNVVPIFSPAKILRIFNEIERVKRH